MEMGEEVEHGKVNAAQLRAARAMLDWSLVDLSVAAKVSVSKIHQVEKGDERQSTQESLSSLKETLEANGVRFLSGHGLGRGVSLIGT